MENKHIQKLTEAAKFLIKEEVNYLEIKSAVDTLKLIFEEVSEINFENASIDKNLFLKTGKAIATKWAGMCVGDMMRTKYFIKGVYKAIKAIQKNKKETPVTILYAGTGPYATLIMPLTTLFKPSELQLILLEINPISLQCLKKTIHNLNATAYIKDMHECDAASFSIPNPNEVDIVLIECLQHALVREPQVAITYNLLSQLKENVILIPEEISLQVSLLNLGKKNNAITETSATEKLNYYKKVETVFVLNKKEILKNSSLLFQKIETQFKEELLLGYNQIAITTEITTFNNEKLTIDESGLTIPLLITYIDNQKIKGVITQYVVNEQPGLEISIINN
jgi:predicted RNA methylase